LTTSPLGPYSADRPPERCGFRRARGRTRRVSAPEFSLRGASGGLSGPCPALLRGCVRLGLRIAARGALSPWVIYFDARPEVGLSNGTEAAPTAGIRPAIAVDSIDQALARVEQAGGRSIEPSRDVGDGYTGVFEDSEGNHIALWAFK
jgi:hypothetical protein